MYILGVNISHHASVCLLKDGEVIFYLEDDRLSRNKEAPFERSSELLSLEKVVEYTDHIDHIIFCSFGRILFQSTGKYPYDTDDNIIKYILERVKFTYDNVHYEKEHHLYHAYNAFYSSGFKSGAALVLDGGGISLEGCEDDLPISTCVEIKFLELGQFYREGETMYTFDSNGKSQCIFKNYTTNEFWGRSMYQPEQIEDNVFVSSSLGCASLFNQITIAIGLHGSQVGKTMGLSSYGNTDHLIDPWFKKDDKTGIWVTDNMAILRLLYNKYPQFYSALKNNYIPTDRKWKFNSDNIKDASDIAKKMQEETKKHTVRLIQDLLDRTCTNNIVLSGGYFLNCVNNYEYVKEFPEVNFYIDPCAHDGGTAMGAARYVWHYILKNTKRHTLDTLFLG